MRPSVVPAKVVFSIDLRHPDPKTLSALGNQIESLCEENAGPCAIHVRELSHDPPLDFPTEISDLVRSIASELGIAHLDLPSAAGHDARHLHYICPTGMIFVPCAGGISHSELESAEPDHLYDGTRVLVETLAELAR